MKERERFLNELNRYHSHLNDRFNNGYDYVSKNPTDEKSYKAYENIIQELSHVETLINYYGGVNV